MVKFGSARIAEDGTVNGRAGDQTGKEIAIETFITTLTAGAY